MAKPVCRQIFILWFCECRRMSTKGMEPGTKHGDCVMSLFPPDGRWYSAKILSEKRGRPNDLYAITLWAIAQKCSKGLSYFGGSFRSPGFTNHLSDRHKFCCERLRWGLLHRIKKFHLTLD